MLPSKISLSFQWSSYTTGQFYGQHFTDTVSFPVASTLKIFCRDLRTMYLSLKIFSEILIQCHIVTREWTYFPLLVYISGYIYCGKNIYNISKKWPPVQILKWHKLLQLYWSALLFAVVLMKRNLMFFWFYQIAFHFTFHSPG